MGGFYYFPEFSFEEKKFYYIKKKEMHFFCSQLSWEFYEVKTQVNLNAFIFHTKKAVALKYHIIAKICEMYPDSINNQIYIAGTTFQVS